MKKLLSLSVISAVILRNSFSISASELAKYLQDPIEFQNHAIEIQKTLYNNSRIIIGLKIENAIIRDIDLSSFNFTIHFFGITFRNTQFINVKFTHTKLDYSRFIQCTFENCDMSNAIFQGGFNYYFSSSMEIQPQVYPDVTLYSHIINCTFTNTNLEKANFTGINLQGTHLEKANLSEANFTAALLKEVNLSGANLKGAIFTGADLIKVNLKEANLEAANFIDAHLKKTGIKNIILSDEIKLTSNHVKKELQKIYMSTSNQQLKNLVREIAIAKGFHISHWDEELWCRIL